MCYHKYDMTMTNLQSLIEQYQPTEAACRLIRDARIVLLVGISGAGKDTVERRVLQSQDFRRLVSYTTRTPRQNRGVMEVDGREYHFINEVTAENMLQQHAFVEAKFVHGTLYGTGVEQIRSIHNEGKIVINDVDVQGIDEYKRLSQHVVAIFVLPPNFHEWRRRLSARYTTTQEFEKEWPKRYSSAIRELTHALEVPYYHFVINDDIDETARIVRAIASKPDVYNRKDDEARLAARELLDSLLREHPEHV